VRTFATFLIVALLGAYAFSAEKPSGVSLRYSRQGSMMRLVVESDDKLINNADVHPSPAGIRIDFTSAFEVTKPKDFAFETATTERSLSIKLKDAKEIKTSRLAAPSRIVFDITTSPAGPREVLPPMSPVVSPGPHGGIPPRTAAPPAGQKVPQPSPSEEKMRAVRGVVLDPGHGGYEYGIVEGSAREKDINLAISRDLAAALSRKGKTVFLTRKVDQSASLAERIAFANAKDPDLFISVHAGLSKHYVIYVASPEDENVDAAVKLYALSYRQSRYAGKSRAAAAAIGLSIQSDFNSEVALRELPLPVLDSLDAPAILIEYPSLKSFAADRKVREKLVASIMKGLAVYER
jgi:N-acetylmuramoyl-L-alanine amidase